MGGICSDFVVGLDYKEFISVKTLSFLYFFSTSYKVKYLVIIKIVFQFGFEFM